MEPNDTRSSTCSRRAQFPLFLGGVGGVDLFWIFSVPTMFPMKFISSHVFLKLLGNSITLFIPYGPWLAQHFNPCNLYVAR